MDSNRPWTERIAMNWFAIVLLGVSLNVGQSGGSDLRQKSIPNFGMSDVSAIRALLELSRTENIPIGIIEDDQRLCTTKISYSAKNAPVATITEGIVAQVPGYKWTFASDFSAIVINRNSPRPVTSQFLNLVPEHYGPAKGNPQVLLTMLWMQVRSLLHPQEGTAVSILSSPDAPVFEVETRNETVRQVLNRIAILTRGVWVLRPIPAALPKVGAEVPFSIFSRAGNSAPEEGDLCQPVLGEPQQ
jgi:hypothetical protein